VRVVREGEHLAEHRVDRPLLAPEDFGRRQDVLVTRHPRGDRLVLAVQPDHVDHVVVRAHPDDRNHLPALVARVDEVEASGA